MYVVLEGVDTCGKTTQIQLLKEKYPQAIFTKEPSGSVLGEKVREMVLFSPQKEGFALAPRAELLLFLADRAQHYAEVLQPNMDKLIISDRSMISGIAYAKSSIRGRAMQVADELDMRASIKMEQIIEFNNFAMQGIKPDLVIMLDLEQEILRERIQNKTHDSIEQRGIEYMLKVQSCMREAIEVLGVMAVYIDASSSREAIHAQICTQIESLLAKKL